MADIDIHPDPDAPYGGFAILSLPEGSLQEAETIVQVQSGYSQLWLAPTLGENLMIGIGEANWQADPYAYGPYAVHRNSGRDLIRIGPEIVNKIEEFAPLSLRIGPYRLDTNWPDNIMPRVAAALIGGVSGVARGAARDTTGDRLVGRRAAPELPPEPEPDTAYDDAGDWPADDDPAPEPTAALGSQSEPVSQQTGSGKSGKEPRRRLLFGLAALLIIALGLAYWLLPQSLTATDDTPATRVPDGTPCSLATLDATPGGFGAAMTAIQGCLGSVNAETAFAVVENAARRGDGAALLMLGTLYDPDVTDPLFEDRLAVSFDPNLALAVEYYAHARSLGIAEAGGRMARTCEALRARADTLSQGAYSDFCP